MPPLTLRPLVNFNGLSNFQYGTQISFTEGDSPLLTFQLVDTSINTEVNGFYPPGLRYCPSKGLTNNNVLNGLAAPDTLQVTVSGSFITIILGTASAWGYTPQIGDLLVIPSGSIISGSTANVGNYTVISATSTTITAFNLSSVAVPVAVMATALSATPTGDLQDFSYGATLYATISPLNNANLIKRWMIQPYPTLDPSIWQFQMFPNDIINGTSDLQFQLSEQGKLTYGIAKSVITVGNQQQINASSARLSPTNVFPIF